ncbi:hypothetical protein BD780_001283 [Clostridium tetanomorphum]|uniref:Uncharacterized protein n=1 Tax=Clostridium tetanomorphum TaxID=1553 RepID=A0A923J1W4_CLOTT|nr:hypothetical protein [Clostridium tetanomorphum]KAJ53601.1 hypothetical protein CTM_01929 [Clostridium tetanomorphum DSM 665]MBC2397808.1 hypothetical protein [Clostridium tetanomorphum]MBP1864589.1 hypothetical protein [Clostridium tetanomorphum]NRS84058.1 hypothetical protein [Clostridium tetanomorphum]NRZ97273.1 hypothetical protein [Clostridium tetanomorphum]
MNFVIEEEKVHNFIKDYFKYLYLKTFLLMDVIWILIFYIEEKNINILTLAIIIFTTIMGTTMGTFFMYRLHYNEVAKYVKNFYSSNQHKEKEDSIKLICNFKKYDGPTFGVLHVYCKKILFIPFKEELQYEKIIINHNNIKDIRINKSSKAIEISYNNRKVLFALPEREYCIKQIKNKILLN